MDLREAKEILNGNGYILENSFVKEHGMETIYKIIEDQGWSPDKVIENIKRHYNLFKYTLDNIEATEYSDAYYHKPKKSKKINVELTEEEQDLLNDYLFTNNADKKYEVDDVLEKFVEDSYGVNLHTNEDGKLFYAFTMPWHWDDEKVDYDWETVSLPYRDLLKEKAKEFSNKTKLFDIEAYPDEEYYDDDAPAIFQIEVLLSPKQKDETLYTAENIEKELRNIRDAYKFDNDLNIQAFHNVNQIQELAEK